MNLRANSTVKFADFARLEEIIVPKLLAAADTGAKAVYDESQIQVPVDTGELKQSGSYRTSWEGKRVSGFVEYDAAHAAFVEFGTGSRGASSTGSGPFPYTLSWNGQPAQPYLRTALDQCKDKIIAGFTDALRA